jgi:hypothetical protein
MTAMKTSQVMSTCVGATDEDRRRQEVLLAVEAVRKRLSMPAWPVVELQQENWYDFCAFEALVFLACPSALVRCGVSLARAKLRGLLGQRELCGWIDTALMCAGSPNISAKAAALLFLKANNRCHVDIATNTGFMALTNNVSLSFSNGTTLSKMFMFVEELLLSNTLSRGGMMRDQAQYQASRRATMCAQIERNGKLAYMWAAMLHELIAGTPMDSPLGMDRYPKFSDQSKVEGAYLASVFRRAQGAWWTNSSVLALALHLIQMEEMRAFNASSTFSAMRGTSTTTSCLSVGEAKELFVKTKTLRPLQVMTAKTWALTTGVLTTGGSAAMTTVAVSARFLQFTAIAVSSVAVLMGSAPVTTALGLGVGAVGAIGIVRQYMGDGAADYVSSLAASGVSAAAGAAGSAASGAAGVVGSEAANIAEPLARAAVRQGAGAAASHATSALNSAAMGAAGTLNSMQSGIDFNPSAVLPDPATVGEGTRGMVEGREVTVGTVLAIEYATGWFSYLTKGTIRLGGGVMVGALTGISKRQWRTRATATATRHATNN